VFTVLAGLIVTGIMLAVIGAVFFVLKWIYFIGYILWNEHK
jgi:hypothetical protein